MTSSARLVPADAKPFSSIPAITITDRHGSDVPGVIDGLGINDFWEDCGPSIEISRWLKTHDLHPIPAGDPTDC